MADLSQLEGLTGSFSTGLKASLDFQTNLQNLASKRQEMAEQQQLETNRQIMVAQASQEAEKQRQIEIATITNPGSFRTDLKTNKQLLDEQGNPKWETPRGPLASQPPINLGIWKGESATNQNSNTLDPPSIQDQGEMITSGKLAPSEWKKLSYYRTTNPLAVMSWIDKNVPWYNFADADTAYKYQQTAPVQQQLANIEAARPIMEETSLASESAKRSAFTAINNLWMGAAFEAGSPAYVPYRALMTHLSPEFATILANGHAMTDQQLQIAQQQFNAKMNDPQIQSALKSLKTIVDAKYKAVYDRTYQGYIARKGKPIRSTKEKGLDQKSKYTIEVQ